MLLRDWALAADIGAGRLVRLFPDYKATYSNFEDGLYAVYPKSDYQPARLTLFLDFLVDYLKGVR